MERREFLKLTATALVASCVPGIAVGQPVTWTWHPMHEPCGPLAGQVMGLHLDAECHSIAPDADGFVRAPPDRVALFVRMMDDSERVIRDVDDWPPYLLAAGLRPNRDA